MKKQKKLKKNTEVTDLAEDILKEEAPIELLDIEEDKPEIDPEILDEPEEKQIELKSNKTEEKEVVVPPKPVFLDKGMTPASAFIITKRLQEMDGILGHYFGSKNGDYFLLNEITKTVFINKQRKRYKGVLLEDKNGFRYNIWFDITSIGFIY